MGNEDTAVNRDTNQRSTATATIGKSHKLSVFEVMAMPRHERRRIAKLNGLKNIRGLQDRPVVKREGVLKKFVKGAADSILNIREKKELVV